MSIRASSLSSSRNDESFFTAPTIAGSTLQTNYSADYEDSISLLSIALSNGYSSSETDMRELGQLAIHCTVPWATLVADLAPVPFIGALAGSLAFVFQAIERSSVNSTLTQIGHRAEYWNAVHEILAYKHAHQMSEEIRSHFSALGLCLSLFP
ncbi:hypothetical protein FRC06_004420, partial [Ceratobasidium sp. 370]